MSDITQRTGSCLCRAVSFQISGPMRQVVACHCGQCLKSLGNFAAFSACDSAQLTFTEDRGLKWYAASDTAKRGFCGECGASLFWKPEFADYISVAAGSLQETEDLKLVRHIYTAGKPGWYEIADGQEQFEGSMYGRDT